MAAACKAYSLFLLNGYHRSLMHFAASDITSSWVSMRFPTSSSASLPPVGSLRVTVTPYYQDWTLTKIFKHRSLSCTPLAPCDASCFKLVGFFTTYCRPASAAPRGPSIDVGVIAHVFELLTPVWLSFYQLLKLFVLIEASPLSSTSLPRVWLAMCCRNSTCPC